MKKCGEVKQSAQQWQPHVFLQSLQLIDVSKKCLQSPAWDVQIISKTFNLPSNPFLLQLWKVLICGSNHLECKVCAYVALGQRGSSFMLASIGRWRIYLSTFKNSYLFLDSLTLELCIMDVIGNKMHASDCTKVNNVWDVCVEHDYPQDFGTSGTCTRFGMRHRTRCVDAGLGGQRPTTQFSHVKKTNFCPMFHTCGPPLAWVGGTSTQLTSLAHVMWEEFLLFWLTIFY